MNERPAAVIVLAAGEGTRMKSATPKMLHEVAGRSLVGHVVEACRQLQPEHLAVVVGHGRDRIVPAIAAQTPEAVAVVQEQQRGTGHAVSVAMDELPPLHGVVVVTYGDVPLQSSEMLGNLVAKHSQEGNAVTVLTAEVTDPKRYGRVVRDANGQVLEIVEHKDAPDDILKINEINSGIYAFDSDVLRYGLKRISSNNAQGEMYLTDVLAFARADGQRVAAMQTDDTWETEGVNNRAELAALGREFNRRITEKWMLAGVTIVDPATTWIDVTVGLGRDVVIRPGVQLRGATRVSDDAEIGPDVTLLDTTVGAAATIVRAQCDHAEIGEGASIGPFAYLRPGARIGKNAKVGTSVEVKASVVAEGAKVPHLTYVGDATIGEGANIGAGTIFANYDGVEKHHTAVGNHTFVGSNSVLVAPLELADGSYVAAGSAVVMPTKPGELAVARGRQRNIAGWVRRKFAGSRTAKAAEEAEAAEADSQARHTDSELPTEPHSPAESANEQGRRRAKPNEATSEGSDA